MGKTKEKTSEDYSKRLKRLRLSLDMTHREFAEKFMVQHSTIGLWESGNREIPGPAKMLIKIYEAENKKSKTK
jgi:DNA-binding transcriptional regulator YiaG